MDIFNGLKSVATIWTEDTPLAQSIRILYAELAVLNGLKSVATKWIEATPLAQSMHILCAELTVLVTPD